MTSGLRATLRSPAVWLGVLGSAAVAWGSSHPEFALGSKAWGADWVNQLGLAAPVPVDRVLLVLGTVLLIWAWWRLRPLPGRAPISAIAVLSAWSLPLLLAPPAFSPDAVAYADLGWILGTGANPYLVGLASSGGPFAAQVDPFWAGFGVSYPPLPLRVDQLIVWASQADPYWSVVAMRLPVLISVAAMLWLVPRLATLLGRAESEALWLGVLNPLLVIHFIGGAHNDAPMVALSLAAIWVVLRWPGMWTSFVAGPALVGLAMAFKQQSGLTAIAVAGLPVAAALTARRRRDRWWLLGSRTAAVITVAAVVFTAVDLLSGLGWGWLSWLGGIGRANTPAPLGLLSKGGALLWQACGGSAAEFSAAATWVSAAVLLGAIMWIVLRFADRPLTALAWASAATAVLGPALHPWYLPWSLSLLALCPLTARQRRVVIGVVVVFTAWSSLQTAIWHGTV